MSASEIESGSTLLYPFKYAPDQIARTGSTSRSSHHYLFVNEIDLGLRGQKIHTWRCSTRPI